MLVYLFLQPKVFAFNDTRLCYVFMVFFEMREAFSKVTGIISERLSKTTTLNNSIIFQLPGGDHMKLINVNREAPSRALLRA